MAISWWKGNLMIDDYEKNIIEWENAGGTGILFISAKDTLSTISEIEKTQR